MYLVIKHTDCYGRNVYAYPTLPPYVEALTLKVMGFGDGASGR